MMIKQKENIVNYISNNHFDYRIALKYIENDNTALNEMIKLSLANDKISWRAAWIIFHFTESNNYDFLQNYTSHFLELIPKIKKDGYLREVIKIINKLDLSEEQESEFFDFCLNVLWNNKMQSSVRSVAFQTMLKTANKYPELKTEIITIFEQIKENLTPGIKNSMSKMINK
jgi:hypothetical protein